MFMLAMISPPMTNSSRARTINAIARVDSAKWSIERVIFERINFKLNSHHGKVDEMDTACSVASRLLCWQLHSLAASVRKRTECSYKRLTGRAGMPGTKSPRHFQNEPGLPSVGRTGFPPELFWTGAVARRRPGSAGRELLDYVLAVDDNAASWRDMHRDHLAHSSHQKAGWHTVRLCLL